MKTKKTKSGLPSAEQSTGRETAKFHDGMIVHAEDLEAATHYPVSLLQTVLRSYFGCGVVCGLELGRMTPHEGEPSWVVTVGRGLAVDCQGFPLELACPIKLDFTPDPCSSEPPPGQAYIAIRRITSDEATSDPCGCSQEPADKDCNRLRDWALVRAFTQAQLDELPDGICRHEGKGNERGAGHRDCAEETENEENTGDATDWCAPLKDCGRCSCDGSWVLLGTIGLGDSGVSDPDTRDRRWVKPVEVLCGLDGLIQRIRDLEESVEQLRLEIQDSAPPLS